MFTRSLLLGSTAVAGAVLFADLGAAQSRYVFSVAWTSPTVGMTGVSGTAITEGDLLFPTTGISLPGPAPVNMPDIGLSHDGVLGLPPICIGHPGGTPCVVEVDAFSRGGDRFFQPNMEIRPGDILFSVDQYAAGTGLGPLPNVRSESSVNEAAPDAFFNLRGMPPAPLTPAAGANIGAIDGNALASGTGYTYPGVGLIEPNTPFGGPADTGDHKDALDLIEPGFSTGRSYFSLDSAFIDPLAGFPNTGSAMFNGFVGGDILVSSSTGTPAVWAPANALGLDFVGGPDSDDLDALILFENGNGVYDPALAPYTWGPGGTDMVLFSVRRGSAIIGMPDAFFGIPIEEGDLLMPRIPGSGSPMPGIFIPAERLGLTTIRSGTAPGNLGDDLTAADTLLDNLFDCDGDGVEDSVAIAFGMVADTNQNGIPDPCESLTIGTPYCFCPATAAPCGNASPTTGCINASATGALLTGSGSTSVSADNLVLTTSGMNPGTFALTFMGPAPAGPFAVGNGLLCVSGPLYRFPPYATGLGTASIGGGLAAYTVANNPLPGHILAGSNWCFQTYYRDIGGPCGSSFNLSSALSVNFTL